jgi:hypothetical protein
MKINEIVSEAPFVKALKSFPAQATKAIKKFPNQIKQGAKDVKQTVKDFPGSVQNYLSKDDNMFKTATDISTIGGGPGLKDYGAGDKSSDGQFQDLLNVLQDKSLSKKIDKQKITTAMTNMYQSDKQLPTDRQYFINAIKHLSATHPEIKPDKIYSEYKPIFKRYQINPNEIK